MTIWKKHPWNLESSAGWPFIVDALIEVPRDTRIKYEVDARTGMLRLERVLSSSLFYPFNYGMLPRTLAEDDAPLDILIVTHQVYPPLSLVQVRVLGLLHVIDNGQRDDKVISVPVLDSYLSYCRSLKRLPSIATEEIRQFFEGYKMLENKQVTVLGISGKRAAFQHMKNLRANYEQQRVNEKN